MPDKTHYDLPRRLLAILHADVAGYSTLIERDERLGHVATSRAIERLEGAILDHGGRVVHFAGDAVLATFLSAQDSLTSAIDAQQQVAQLNRDEKDLPSVSFRIGISLGDVILDRNDVFGEAVNIAARLQSLAVPGGICITEGIHDQVADKCPVEFIDLGDRWLRNMGRPAHIYGVSGKDVSPTLPTQLGSKTTEAKPSIVVTVSRHEQADILLKEISENLFGDVLARLSEVPDMMVLNAQEPERLESQHTERDQIGGPRYVLHIRLREHRGRVRISARVSDQYSGTQYWAGLTDCGTTNHEQTIDELSITIADVVAGLAIKPGHAPRFVRSVGKIMWIGMNQLRVRIDHEAIPGFMEAMTMVYPVHSSPLLTEVEVGDQVSFTINTEDRLIVAIKKLPEEN